MLQDFSEDLVLEICKLVSSAGKQTMEEVVLIGWF